jgi:hypothetical protein
MLLVKRCCSGEAGGRTWLSALSIGGTEGGAGFAEMQGRVGGDGRRGAGWPPAVFRRFQAGSVTALFLINHVGQQDSLARNLETLMASGGEFGNGKN